MKKLVLMGGVIVVLFGISAAASWFLRHGQAALGDHGEVDESSLDKKNKGPANSGVTASPPPELRPAVRAQVNPEVDSAAQLASNLRTQMDALRVREQQFTARQKSLELISQDIRTERNSMDELRKQLNEELKGLTERVESLERKAGEVDQKRKQLSDQNKELNNSMVRVESSEKDNIKHLATVYDSMDADAAAQHLQQMADTGKIETAAKILAAMRERQAAKVLAQFPDHTTVVQLLEKMRSVDRSPAPAKAENAPVSPGGG
jgi:flagellar motility protein MotE (MotC chaperone)